MTSASVLAGGNDTLNYTVKNTGNATAAASTLGIYRSTDLTISTADTLIATVAIASLAAGATRSGHIAVTMPATVGTYYLGAIADYNNAIVESSYSDNASTGVQVDVTPAPQANLVVSSVSVTSPSVLAGDSDTLNYTINNAGNATAAASTLGIYLSSDSTISTADTLITTVPIIALAAGASKSGSISVTMPATVGTVQSWRNRRLQ